MTRESKKNSNHLNYKSKNVAKNNSKTREENGGGKKHNFWQSFWGKFTKLILTLVLLFLLDLLISKNNYSVFYLLWGLELLLGFVVIIVRLIWQQKNIEK